MSWGLVDFAFGSDTGSPVGPGSPVSEAAGAAAADAGTVGTLGTGDDASTGDKAGTGDKAKAGVKAKPADRVRPADKTKPGTDPAKSGQGVVRDGKGQEQPADAERARRVSRADRGNDPPGEKK